jgi:predicted short-subunit dehydrogenase-like oxidoreductase (DUF2520 family)
MNQHIISFAGAGRVASALCREFFRAEFSIDLIVSQTEKNGRSLADSCNALWSSELLFPDSTEVVIVSVPDHNLKSVLHKMRCSSDTLVAHTAGSFGIDVFPEHIKRKGIIYPLQTFTNGRKIDFKKLPFLLEASDEQSSAVLQMLAESIGGKAGFSDFENRRLLHLAAVFSSNFTNHMLTIGRDIALKAGFSFEILEPLIIETISKAVDLGPENSQTGPAIRNDQITIGKHLELLSFDPELHKIYSEMTRSIIKKYNKKG